MRKIPAIIGLLLAIASTALGQTSFPMITHASPVAVQRGKTVEVTVEGQQNFSGAYQLLISGSGITAEVQSAPPVVSTAKTSDPRPAARSVKIKLSIAADAKLGVREFRIATSLGVSSLGQLFVVDEPVVEEKGVNNTIAQAQAVTIPSVICGRIEATEDVDCYRFAAKQGQALAFEVSSARLQDKIHDLQKHIDPLVVLLDSAGRELAANDDANFADPLLTFTIPKDGDYILQIRDAKYDGDPRWTYAVRATDRPFASHVHPMAGNPGQTMKLAPVGTASAIQPAVSFQAPTQLGFHEVQLDIGGKSTNPVAFYVTPLPVIVEQEPNDAPAQAMRLSIPCAVAGRISQRRDADHFVFRGSKGRALRIEVKARRFGTVMRSGLDSYLEVLSSKGAVLAANDDNIGKDAGVTFTPPTDDDYVVRLRDLNSKGGDSFVYCIEFDWAVPEFSLRVDPGKAMIGPGSSMPWYVIVTRSNGFAGPVEVAIEGLPPGVAASRLTIPATMTQGLVVLTADLSAKVGASMVRVVGKASIKSSDGPERTVLQSSVVSEEIYMPGGGRGRFEADMPAVAVTEPSDILRVDVTPKEISLKPGEEVRLDVTIERRKDYDKSVSLDILLRHLGSVYGNPLPPGVTIVEGKSKTLIGTTSKGHIVLKADATAAPIENVPVSVLAHVSINFVVKISYSSPVIPLSIRK
jgi:hypothetical protein